MPRTRSHHYINASEVADFVYCHRAWWLKLTGHKSRNVEAMTEVQATQPQPSAQVQATQPQQWLGGVILFVGVIILLASILLRFLA